MRRDLRAHAEPVDRATAGATDPPGREAPTTLPVQWRRYLASSAPDVEHQAQLRAWLARQAQYQALAAACDPFRDMKGASL